MTTSLTLGSSKAVEILNGIPALAGGRSRIYDHLVLPTREADRRELVEVNEQTDPDGPPRWRIHTWQVTGPRIEGSRDLRSVNRVYSLTVMGWYGWDWRTDDETRFREIVDTVLDSFDVHYAAGTTGGSGSASLQHNFAMSGNVSTVVFAGATCLEARLTWRTHKIQQVRFIP